MLRYLFSQSLPDSPIAIWSFAVSTWNGINTCLCLLFWRVLNKVFANSDFVVTCEQIIESFMDKFLVAQ